jgi:hypothetical protein
MILKFIDQVIGYLMGLPPEAAWGIALVAVVAIGLFLIGWVVAGLS